MYETNDLQNRKYETVLRDLKADIYDVLSIEAVNISALEDKLALASNEEKEKLEKQLKEQREKLDNTVKVAHKLIENIETLDTYKKEEVKSEKVAQVITDIEQNDPILKIALNQDLQKQAESKEEVKQEISDAIDKTESFETIVKPSLENAMDIITQGPSTTAEADQINNIIDDNIKEEKDEKTTLIEAVPELQDIYKKEELLDKKKEKTEEEIKEIKQDENIPKKEKKEILNQKRIFQKKTKKVTKAIIVSKKQLEKLAKSRVNQEQLLLEKRILSETDGFGTVKNILDNRLVKEISKEENILEQNPDIKPKEYDDPKREIEDLMVKAKVLYEANEKEEAQKMFDRISELNKVVSGDTQTKK